MQHQSGEYETATRGNRALVFRAIDRRGALLSEPMHRNELLRMVKRRCMRAGVVWQENCCRSFRATGISNYIRNGGDLDVAQEWAGHADPRSTNLYNRERDRVTVVEVARMRFERDPK